MIYTFRCFVGMDRLSAGWSKESKARRRDAGVGVSCMLVFEAAAVKGQAGGIFFVRGAHSDGDRTRMEASQAAG